MVILIEWLPHGLVCGPHELDTLEDFEIYNTQLSTDCGWCWGREAAIRQRDFRASLAYNKRTSDPTGYAVAIFSCHCGKVRDRSSLQEEKVILAQALRGSNLHVRARCSVKASW